MGVEEGAATGGSRGVRDESGVPAVMPFATMGTSKRTRSAGGM